jgi:glycosyltransferase involved in cell wall biosynthesis
VTGPRLGVVDFHPIQYHAPLYRRLAERGQVEPAVLYLRDYGYRATVDPAFGVSLSWDVDLLTGYESRFLRPPGLADLTRWLRGREAVVIHGYSDPWMQTATALCRLLRVPYLLRGDAGPESRSAGLRRRARDALATAVVSGSAGGLAIGERNAAFYRKYGARSVTFAPHSVDNDRFARPPAVRRAEVLGRWGLDPGRPVLAFCGKLQPRKRPLDLVAAAGRLEQPVSTLFVGDGALAGELRARLTPGRGAVTGFVNQSELPAVYHAADVLVLPSADEPWGLVVNEAMAAGLLPVVSDRVGAGPDLVSGLGEIYPCGDVAGLAAALRRALARLADPALPALIAARVDRYGLDQTAAGFEQAALAACRTGQTVTA